MSEVYRQRPSPAVLEPGDAGDVEGLDRSGYAALAVTGGGRPALRPMSGRNSGGIAATRAGRPAARKRRAMPAWIRPAGPGPGGRPGGGAARAGGARRAAEGS